MIDIEKKERSGEREMGFLKEENFCKGFRLGLTLFLRPLDSLLFDRSQFSTHLSPPLDLFQL